MQPGACGCGPSVHGRTAVLLLGSSRPPLKEAAAGTERNRMTRPRARLHIPTTRFLLLPHTSLLVLLASPGPSPEPVTPNRPSGPRSRTHLPSSSQSPHIGFFSSPCCVSVGVSSRGMAKRRAMLWAAALTAVVILLLAACTAAAAVTISRKHQHHRASSSSSASAARSCDPFAASGAWVEDESYPLYDSAKCPFIRDEFACARFGRPDTAYLRYRWQLDLDDAACVQQQPRFDGVKLLRMWAGKTVMFVGDSLALNQYESLLCLLHAAAGPGVRTSLSPASGKIDPSSTVRFEDYNVTVVYYLTHYLVDLVTEPSGRRVLKLDAIDQASDWLAADVLVFDSWHWWPRTGPTQPWDVMQVGSTVVKDMDRTKAFTKALHTWARWVDANLVHTDTKVFFQGISPSHYRGQDWGASPKKTCMGETRPLNLNNGTGDPPYPGGPIPQQAILRGVLAGMAKPVYLLDFTYLSQLRKDAHPTKYDGGIFGGDCTHWCVAGLPDTWNVLFYAALTAEQQD